MDKDSGMRLSSHCSHGFHARDAEKEPDVANKAEREFREAVQSYTTQIASPIYLMEVLEKARSAAQYCKDSEGLKDSQFNREFSIHP
jgi:hypothetical protein